MYCHYLRKEIVWNDSIFFFEIHDWEIERTRQMTHQEDNIDLGKVVLDGNNQERKSWACLGRICSRSSMCFCPNFLWFCWLSLVAFGEFIFQKLVTNPLLGWEFCVVQQDTFYPHKDHEQVNFYRKPRLYIIGRSLRDGKVTIYLQLAQTWNFSTKTWPKFTFLSTVSDTLWCYAKRNWKSRVCSKCKFWIYRLVKKRYKILVNVSRVIRKDLQLKSICWHCYCWQTSWIENYLH